MSQQEANQDYINKKVDPILEKLVVDLLLNKPEDVVEFMIEWLTSKKDKLKKDLGISGGNASPKRKGSISDDDDDDVLDLPVPAPTKKGARTSVSAEAYGMWNKKGAYVPKVIAKSEEIKKKIHKRLEEAFMFSALDDKEKEIVINAMEEKRFKAGDTVIKQGDDGDTLYLVESGQLDCYKKFKDANEPKHLKVYNPGESFGELALLYNAPRAATIKAKTDCICYSLDRDCFNNIVKDAAMRKRERYEGFLTNVELLQAMDPYERSNIADALKPEKFKAGEYVVKQGETGTTFYFIEEGSAVATKSMKPGEPPVEVYQYKEGDYFGELALLKNVSRQANVVAKSNLSVVKLERDSFARMLGNLEDILKRNMVRYEKYM